ncbi:MAG TPA: type II methionyl aminopeptidase [Candidatus Bathyarchaeia archaeon]
MLDSEEIDSFRKAGGIIAKLRREVPALVKPGKPVIEICEELEHRIKTLGGEPAFPVNVGINEIAAHYTSPPGDTLTIPRACIVKIDFGVHIKGYLADTAVTVVFDPHFEPMARAADEALSSAIRAFRPGVKMSEVGRIIQTTVERYGFKPIRNLTGHSIQRYTIHAGKSVPNVSQLNGGKTVEGEVYAIEPFVTRANASGAVTNTASAHIYRFIKTKGAKTEEAKKVIQEVYSQFSSLPFAARWLERKFTREIAVRAIKELLDSKCIGSYPVLIEETRQPVAQSEHTVLVTADGCSVLTGS